MNVVITDDALAKLDQQITYIADQGATQAARKLLERVHQFLTLSLTLAPRRGRHIAEYDMWCMDLPRFSGECFSTLWPSPLHS